MNTSGICLFCFCLILTSVAHSQSTITFDDIAATGLGNVYTSIPNDYQGFSWNNFDVINTTALPPTGFGNGTVSTPNVAYNGGGGNPSSFSSGVPFLIVSGYFTSAYRNGMTLEVAGLNGATTQFDEIFTLNLTGSSFITFPAMPVTQVDFTTSGGVIDPDYVAGPSVMALDNLTIEPVPEPSAELLCGVGFGLLGLWRKWRNP